MVGFCHICMRLKMVKYCGWCKHWLCDRCRNSPLARVKAFMSVKTSKQSTDCCGPFVIEKERG